MKPISEVESIEKPRAYMRKMAPRKAMGMPAATHSARWGRRNRASRISTSSRP
jgi:hypothetical protein